MPQQISNNNRIAKNTIFLYIRMVLVLAINLYITRVLLRALGEVGYGTFNVIAGIVVFTSFINSSMTNGFQRFFNMVYGRGDKDEYDEQFKAALSVQMLMCGIFIIVSETLGVWFLNTQLKMIPADLMFSANVLFQTSVIVFLLVMLVSPFNAIIISYERMNVFAVISIIQVLLKLCAVFFLFIVESERLILYGFLLIAVELIVLFLYVVASKRFHPSIKIRLSRDKERIRKMLSFSGWNLLGAFAHTSKGQGLNMVLGMFFSPEVNAARGIAYQISAGVCQMYSNFQLAARPQIIKNYARGEIKAMLKLVNDISRLSFLLLLIPIATIIFSLEDILNLWLAEVPALTSNFTILVLFTSLIESLATPISNIAHATGEMKRFQIICSFFILLILPLAYIVLSLGYPPEAALVCSLIMAPIIHLVRIILVRKIIQFSIHDYLLNVVFPCVTVSVLSIGVLYLFYMWQPNIGSLLKFFLSFVWTMIVVCFIGLKTKERRMIFDRVIAFTKRK